MADEEDIELLHITKYYFRLAKRSARRVTAKHISPGTLRKRTNKKLLKSAPSPENRVFAHLASAAIRICTLHEKHKFTFMTVYHEKLYSRDKKRREPQGLTKSDLISEIRNNLSTYVSHLLRDCIAHYENKDKLPYGDRLSVISKLRIDACMAAMESVIKDIEFAVGS